LFQESNAMPCRISKGGRSGGLVKAGSERGAGWMS
jgi:hypothetical protein